MCKLRQIIRRCLHIDKIHLKNTSFLYLTPTIAPDKMQPKNNFYFFSAYKRVMYPLMEMAILIMNVSEMKDVLQTIHFDAN